ncbi:thiamine-phosphate kinase [Modicisalibacter radicis]|uniref:thiamine-phosphate kinase n=1 Tax=Halomonas sp. EAR18 TaxID=2518972 RepID=UPI00109C1318|nr:thiamine-phosphate kinase [Halomonas sp. EAR18]
MLSEFELIARYFAGPAQSTVPGATSGVVQGPGDDCAVLAPTPGSQLAVSVDTSLAEVHFPADAPATAIGHRALAVALSDLAAMGARARWCVMAISLPEVDDAWLAGFAEGFHALCRACDVALAGGDVTRGPLSVSVTVHGEIPAGQALSRGGGRAGDVLAVTGALGGGRGGLEAWQAGVRELDDPLLAAYLLPLPRLAAGEALRGLAHCAIDISDGLLVDLDHLCSAGGLGAELDVAALPLSDGLVARLGETGAREAALCGGDDYELLISLPSAQFATARQGLAALDVPLTAIGRLRETPGIAGVDADLLHNGWRHFPGGAS